ncbi:MAG: hypothetical protein HZB14_10305 [Actinobacteria bacterium]|nr:hypothetical protein [Actinomycetota bacterium]
MRDIEISRPIQIALIGAILLGGYLLYNASQGGEEVVPPTPAPTSATGATGATGASGSTGATGGSGATGPTETSAERRARLKKERIAKLKEQAKEAGIPYDVFIARKQGKEVVIFFWEPDGKDDARVNAALKELDKRRKKLVIFRDEISNKSNYDGIAQAAEVTQTPGLVIVYHDKADVWQGYIDADTLNERIERLVD